MSSRASRSEGSSRSSRHGKKSRSDQSSNAQLIESLRTHRVNTLTELRRIEKVAAACDDEADAAAFQEPMTAAWSYYVSGGQFLVELRGLTPNYPMGADVLSDAVRRVRSDPGSNRSWNMAWLCLVKIRDDGLIPHYSNVEAWKREMWGGRDPTQEEADQLGACFEWEWMRAVESMLRHWADGAPTWY
ncbi:hypothetical protein BJ166DRAFT_597395 [Pestalotiopsis sp. NC0098]|nr:hypothetical protein BJ166DRAFT_597395 [Pestalotiopsis sp. NC0098]